ncbi:MAG: YfhO family protein [Acetatifactor sp.]
MKGKTQKITLLSAFLLPVFVMMILFVIKKIYPFGDASFLSGDLYHQYMPFFRELLRKVRAGESLDFSFYVGIGSNFMALLIYYLASPLHVFSLLVPERFLIEFISYLIVLKVGLCGLTATIYLQKHFKTNSPAVLLFSMFYAFSGFMAAYNYNIMWVDCVWLFPLIILGLERLVKEGKYGLYCVSLAISIFTNFYLSIMICIFLVFYFGFLLLTERGHRLRSVGYFTLFSLLAGGMAAIMLIPEARALTQTDFGDMDFPKKVVSYFSVLDMLARHCVCVSAERGLAHWPNIYCGSAVLFLVPMYLMNKKISIREKFLRLGLAGFLLLSFATNFLDFIWHGMNYPDSLPARQSFIYVLLVLTMCYDAFRRVREVDRQQILYGYVAAVCFILFCQKFIEQEHFELGVKLLTLFFVTVYAILLYLYRTREKRETILGIAIVAFVAVTVECCVNTWDTSIGTTSRSAYLGQLEDYRELYEMTKEREDSLYRVEKFSRKTKNDGTLAGYPTASVFSSTMNSQVMDLYGRLGMRHSKVYYSFDGATVFTSALLNVNYMFGKPDYEFGLYDLVEESGEVGLYQCKYNLPFGYTVPYGYELPEGYEYQPMTLQNLMAEELGAGQNVFHRFSGTSRGNDVSFTAGQEGEYYAVLTTSGTRSVKCIGGSRNEEEFGDLKRGCVIYLGNLQQGQTLTLTNGDEKDETPRIDAEFYRVNTEELTKVLDALSAYHLDNVSWGDNKISGSISLKEARRLILSVPNEEGWTVRINGEETEAGTFGGCLVALDLEPGEYEIQMEYRAAGADAGIVVSAVFLTLYIFIVAFPKIKSACTRNTNSKRVSVRREEDEEEDRECSSVGSHSDDGNGRNQSAE